MRFFRLTTFAALISSALVGGMQAIAQDYPTKPVRIIVPYAIGGVTDNSVRTIVEKLGVRLGQQVIVDNRPGGGGNMGTQLVAQAAPDGYTLLLGFDGNFCVSPHTYKSLPFDPIRDFAPVTKLGDATIVLVAHPSFPANTLPELIALSKKKPGSLSFGTAGTGQTSHVVGELLNFESGIDMLHIPYKGGAPALADLIGGQIPLVMSFIAGAAPFVKQGRAKAIGVASAKRDPAMPDVPTFLEMGSKVEATSWVGILAPAKTPRPIIDRLQREIAAVLQEADVRTRYAALGMNPVGNSPDEFGAQIRADFAKWEPVVKRAKIQAE
ncbi:MAG: tripartite tricarboxylate transporter substrate binding protein [Betaproteobacteria bacterium]|nr:tripartite tricarboxylate transporter substrate binding protein [Betaproteobacteria bacterium]